MVRNKDKVFMLGATMARMGVGMLTFLLLARFLGPVSFGLLAVAMAYSALANVVTDFGFPISALRHASADIERSGMIVARTLYAKLCMTAVLVVAGVPLVMLFAPAPLWLVYALVMWGNTANSFADMIFIASRARKRFDVEAVLVIGNSLLMVVIVGAVAAMTHDLLSAALAFALTRTIYLLVVAFALRDWVRLRDVVNGRPRDLAGALREGSGFATDSILTSFSSQIDVFVYSALLVAHDMGVYQAGSRLIQVVSPLAVVLSTVYMPTLSKAALTGDEPAFLKAAGRLNLEFLGLGLACGIAFAVLGPIATRLVFGHHYDGLLPLWGGFGAFALLRLTASALGIQLAALGEVRYRVGSQVCTMVAFAVLAWWLIPHGPLAMTSRILAMSGLATISIYGVGLILRFGRNVNLIATLGVSIAAAIALFSF